ncbi:hypothetical protein SASPL_132447 [Salvia splendens]|uniref:LysM domain-containing protein n=1 Tax=Salvia splendens TaxID=180675 RepID=A0A8X8X318_SALSN|nr:hypothetical protein SASPL_132447 [Salvia splendens]
MANYSKATAFLSVAVFLLALVLVHVAESRVLPKSGDGKAKSILICTEPYGAADGDTCFSITKSFNLTTDFFTAMNPNLDCDKIFISQWLCVDGFSL